MDKFKPLVSLDMRITQSDIVGMLDLNEDGELIIVVDEQKYLFDSVKDYFIGGTI